MATVGATELEARVELAGPRSCAAAQYQPRCTHRRKERRTMTTTVNESMRNGVDTSTL